MSRLRHYSIEITLVMVLALSVAFFGYLGYGLLPANATAESFSGEQALTQARRQVAFGTRATGTPTNTQAGDALVNELAKLGWDVLIDPFGLPNGTTARNLIAIRSHDTPNSPVGLLGAHYDSRLVADADPNPANQTLPTPGAVNNAAGVAILLELARTLDGNASGHTVCLVFFDADDNANVPGWEPLLGSSHFLQGLSERVPRCASPRFAIIVNTVGYAGQTLYRDSNGHPGLTGALWETAAGLGADNPFRNELIDGAAGAHLLFAAVGIPAVRLSGQAYPLQHTLQDSADQLDAASLTAVGSTLESWLEAGATFAP